MKTLQKDKASMFVTTSLAILSLRCDFDVIYFDTQIKKSLPALMASVVFGLWSYDHLL